jgi:hypothetical protein
MCNKKLHIVGMGNGMCIGGRDGVHGVNKHSMGNTVSLCDSHK